MVDIKDQIKEKLQTINDTDFLCVLLDLMNNVNQKGQYQFSKSQLEDINESLEQISNGEFVTHHGWKRVFFTSSFLNTPEGIYIYNHG